MTEPIADSAASDITDGDPWKQLRAIIESLADGIVIVDSARRHSLCQSRGRASVHPKPRRARRHAARLPAGRRRDHGDGDRPPRRRRSRLRRAAGRRHRMGGREPQNWSRFAMSPTASTPRNGRGSSRTSATRGSRQKRRAGPSRIFSPSCRTSFGRRSTRSSAIPSSSSSASPASSPTRCATRSDASGAARSICSSLVNDILDLAKVEAGRLTVANAPATVSEAVTSALSLIEPQAEAKNLALVVDSGRPTVLPAYIGDDERVRQILVNLLSNAVKCTEPGGTITIDSARDVDARPARAAATAAARTFGSP